ncbi:hypothetical protein ACJIZ3_000047 [Penstemon smallii]|uniref:Cytochrome P450 n=1 Tax=Penstemon smallii TaxID=265156 RepID=A0ABD3RBC7_9LAMI
MVFSTGFIVLPFLVVLAWVYIRSNSRHRGRSSKLPPGPYPFPIIGNILQLGRNPHQLLAKLSSTYGPLMSLHLGSMYTVVVSSPEMAKEILQKHDLVFSSRRTIPTAGQAHDFHKNSIGLLPVGTKWRNLRKICKEHMFSTHSLEASQGLRQEKLEKLCEYVQECCLKGRVVNIGEVSFVTTLNLMSATLFSIDFTDFDSDNAQKWKETIEGFLGTVGSPNVADFFPVLKMFDPQGIKRGADFYIGKLLSMFEDVINQRLESRKTDSDSSKKKKDLLEVLIHLSEGSEYDLSLEGMKHFLLELFMAGSDTTASTVEWVMTELLQNPKKMSSVKNELITVIEKNIQVKESDISKLPYLEAVINEVLRLHPPGPLLLPRKSESDVEIKGYIIPKNSQILVNVWAIGRESSAWPNPNTFEPERFLDKKFDFNGQNFNFIPFGSGRRMCPGLQLAIRMLPIMVASLIHNFDWKLELGTKPEELDTSEKFGLALHKAVPLKALPIKL